MSQIYFCNKTVHVSDSSSVNYQEFFTVHTAMVHVIEVLLTACEQDQDGTISILILLSSYQQNLYDIYHCCVYSEKTLDDWQRNCPKYVELYSKNKFEKLVHLVGFSIRIYHDARSPERHICLF